MSMQDPIADMLTRIRNAQMVHHISVDMSASKLKIKIAEVLKREGYIEDFTVEGEGSIKSMRLLLRYYQGKPVIQEIDRYSKPSLRRYSSVDNLPRVCNGLGIAIISTSHGVLTDVEARKLNVGGEVLATVF